MPERVEPPIGIEPAAVALANGEAAWRDHERPLDATWLTLNPDSWRRDLLRIVLGYSVVFGSLVCIPSIFISLKLGLPAVAVVDASAIALVLALFFVERMSIAVRAGATCLVFYAVGVALMINVGAISQIYLFGFSLLTTLLLSRRWGIASAVLNTVTMLIIGYVGSAAPEMLGPRWRADFDEWAVITANFAFVNASLVLALSVVIGALENALSRAFAAREALLSERMGLVELNASLEQEVHERIRSERSLVESRALLRIAGLTARLGGWRVEVDGAGVVWSDEVCELFEQPPGTTPTRNEMMASLVAEFQDDVASALEQCGRDGTPFDVEGQIVTATGAQRWVRMIGNALRDAGGTSTHIHGSMQDITPQKLADARHARLEEQLRQAQKLETIGGLAGGVAHDFNNLMSIVLSYSEMMSLELRPDDPVRSDLDEIHKAGTRAAELTRQLLAFSRQQVLAPRLVDLGEIVHGMESMLRRLIGEDVELTTSCAAGLGNILVDPGQIEQVIMNLSVNARDAMPRGGMLTIQAAAVMLDAHYAAEHVGVTPGPHVMLAVSDTGLGMSKETQARMFEPFFTTKEKGKGTGLGLATVFGIVRQSGGTIWAYSEPGQGTSFKAYFPVAEASAGALAPAPAPERDDVRGSETILVVEDEERIRVLACAILRKQGYNVLDAQNGGEALLLCEQFTAPIHLLLTDVVMPRMSGRLLAERLRPIRRTMKVLYMSGYTDDAVVRHGILDSTIAFIQKPITPTALVRKVRDVLDGR